MAEEGTAMNSEMKPEEIVDMLHKCAVIAGITYVDLLDRLTDSYREEREEKKELQ